MIVGRKEIDYYNKTHRQDGFKFTYRSPKFVDALSKRQMRLRTHPATRRKDGSPGWPAWKSLQVLWNGKWYDLCRTDLKDNVTTYGGIDITGDTCRVKLTNSYGARITKDTIYVIDRFSDG